MFSFSSVEDPGAKQSPCFVDLLRQLEDVHNHEIGKLCDVHNGEIGKLRVVLDESRRECLALQEYVKQVRAGMSSNSLPKTPKAAEFSKPQELGHGTSSAEAVRESSMKSFELGSETIPDEGIDTPFLLAGKEVNQGFKAGHQYEDESVEKPDNDVLEAVLRVAAQEEETSEEQQIVLGPDDKAVLEARRAVGFRVSINSSPSVDMDLGPANKLERWDRLIKAVKAQQAVLALPGLNEVWQQLVEESPSQEFSLQRGATAKQLEMLVARATVMKSQRDVDITISGELLEKVTKTDSWFSRAWKTSMLHPTSRRRAGWDVAGISLLVHDMVVIPLHVFDSGTDGIPKPYEEFMDVLDIVAALFWTVDILVSFRTGIYSEQGFVEMRPWPVARNYCRSWLPLDVFIVCTDWCTMFLGMSSAAGFMRIGKSLSRIMRVLRLLRFLKMNQALIQFLARIHSEYVLQVMGLMKTLVLIVIINHYIACGWYGLGRAGFISSWPDLFLVNYPESFSYAYTTSLHWSLTQFTPASMEVVPQNSVERFFVIAVIIVALVAFSSFVSSITTTMTYIRQMNAQKMELEAKIRQFFSEHNISQAMASRVWHYLRHNRIRVAKRLKEKDIPAFEVLPERIKEDMRLEVYLPTLTVHPLFAEYGKREQFAMRKICNEALFECSLAVGEELWRGVSEVKDMLFVVQGSLVYHEEAGSLDPQQIITDNYAEIGVGQWACELALWAEKAALPGTFMALTHGCEYVLLSASDFQEIVSQFGGSLNFLSKYASLFMDGFRSATEETYLTDLAHPQDVIFNRMELAEELVLLAQGTRRSAIAQRRITQVARNIMMGNNTIRSSDFIPDKDAEASTNSFHFSIGRPFFNHKKSNN